MSVRAQLYLAVTAVFHLSLALFCLLDGVVLASPSYYAIQLVAPFWAWGLVMLVVGIVCSVAAVTRHETTARVGLLLAVLVTASWAAGFVASAAIGTLAGPTGPLVWAALLAKDLLQCRSPLRVPMESVVRRLAIMPPREPMILPRVRSPRFRRPKG